MNSSFFLGRLIVRLAATTFVVLVAICSQASSGDEFWDGRFGDLGIEITGLEVGVRAIAVMGNDVFVGGHFSKAGPVAVANIARWDGTNWWPLAGGVDGLGVAALAVSGTNLFAGGFFTRAGDSEASGIARWDGVRWFGLGGGVQGAVTALAVDRDNLYVGGYFPQAGGVRASNIARWTGAEWQGLGGGVTRLVRGDAGGLRDGAVVHALSVKDQQVYAGGWFTKAGNVAVTNVAQWDGTSWAGLGGGSAPLPFAQVLGLAFAGASLFIGSEVFPSAPSGPTNIVFWNGLEWVDGGSELQPEQSGFPYFITALVAKERILFAGGSRFRFRDSMNLAQWNGTFWEGLGSGISPDGGVYALAVNRDRLYVGGAFTTAGGKPARNFSIWHIPDTLAIRRTGMGVAIWWPAARTNHVLETAARVPSTSWTEVQKPPMTQDGQLTVSEEIGATNRFYRLRKKE